MIRKLCLFVCEQEGCITYKNVVKKHYVYICLTEEYTTQNGVFECSGSSLHSLSKAHGIVVSGFLGVRRVISHIKQGCPPNEAAASLETTGTEADWGFCTSK